MHDNISDINSDHSQVLRIDCDAPMTTEQTTEKATTNSSNIDTTTTVTTTGKSLVTSALSHDMLKLKIHIHEILNNNFRFEFPKLNK
jgi:hypothetical protein